MKLAIEKVAPSINEDGSEDGFQGQGGWVPAYLFEGHVLDYGDPDNMIREGDYLYAKGNFKRPPVQGSTGDFECKISKKTGKKISFRGTNDDGTEVWRVVLAHADTRGGPPQRQQGGAQPHRGPSPQPQRQNAPAGAVAPSGGTSSAPARQVPTESQVITAFQRINAKLGVEAESGQATTIVLGLLLGDIRRDPTAAELAAIEAAKQAAQQAEAARLAAEAEKARLAAEAAVARIPGYQGPAPTNDANEDGPVGTPHGDIPFGLLFALGTALHFGASLIA